MKQCLYFIMLKCELAMVRFVAAFHSCLVMSTVTTGPSGPVNVAVIHPCKDLDNVRAKGIRAGGGIDCTLCTQSKTVTHAWVEPRSWR